MNLKTITHTKLKSTKPYRNKYGTDLWAFDIAFESGESGIANGASMNPYWEEAGTVVQATDSTYKDSDGNTIWKIKPAEDMNAGKPDSDGFKVKQSTDGTSTGFVRERPDKSREIAIQACINQASLAATRDPHYVQNGYTEQFKQTVSAIATDLLEVRDAITNNKPLVMEENPF
tara:strand:- start:374 stop:895 length:522 start_codon:yes stop_codon:yes gene_type:complete